MGEAAKQVTIFGEEEDAHTKRVTRGGALYRPYLNEEMRRLWLRSIEHQLDAGPQIKLLGFKMLLLLVEWHQAELPFELTADPIVSSAHPASQPADDEHPFRDLSEEEMISIHEWMFHHWMRLLNDSRTGHETKVEILDWITAPLLPNDEVRKIPFSFQACAVCMGCDPEELRTRLVRDIAPKIAINFDGSPVGKTA